ncbi:MAG TPA: tyrosine-type recombinase/integrase [Trebonia sp.]|jgi:integrase|nr:tyrosine-type recombinase/integrase [Trebonia sp.]
MTQAPVSIFKILTESPQPARGPVGRARKAAVAKPKATGLAAGRILGVETRAATRGDGEVIELDLGITVYPPRDKGGRWRAVWHEGGERQQCESVSKEKLAAKLEKVRQRLATGAANMTRPGADLIAWYLNPDRLAVADRWSRKHADTQRRLCQRFAAPVIGAVTCQDVTTSHTQKIVNAAPTAGEGDRVHRMLSALVGAGLKGGYLVNPMLAEVHWQAVERPVPAPAVGVAGESSLWVDPSEIPSSDDVAILGKALSTRRHGERDELMANLAAYSGLRWGELAALTIGQVAQAARVITVDRKVVEVGGHLYAEPPKNRKFRRSIYPRRTPAAYPLAERLAARIEEARAEQEAGTNPQGLIFPSRSGGHWRSSNYNRNILQPAYLKAGWRGSPGAGRWTWHSLRHVFCTTALFTWKLDPTDVSRMAGHANYRITLDMYVGTTAGVLDRARAAAE